MVSAYWEKSTPSRLKGRLVQAGCKDGSCCGKGISLYRAIAGLLGGITWHSCHVASVGIDVCTDPLFTLWVVGCHARDVIWNESYLKQWETLFHFALGLYKTVMKKTHCKSTQRGCVRWGRLWHLVCNVTLMAHRVLTGMRAWEPRRAPGVAHPSAPRIVHTWPAHPKILAPAGATSARELGCAPERSSLTHQQGVWDLRGIPAGHSSWDGLPPKTTTELEVQVSLWLAWQ